MPIPLTTRILLADDHVLVRDGLKLVLESVPDLEVVAEAGDGVEALHLAVSEEFDLAVLDVSMPRHDRPAGRPGAGQTAPRAPRLDALGPRQRAVLLRGAQGRRVRVTS